MNGTIQNPDLQFQRSELIDNSVQRLFHRRRKSFAITLVRDDLGKLRETFASRLRSKAELGKMGSKRIDHCVRWRIKRSSVRCNISKAS